MISARLQATYTEIFGLYVAWLNSSRRITRGLIRRGNTEQDTP